MKPMDILRGIALVLLVIALAVAMVEWAYAEGQLMYVCTELDPLNVREEPNIHSDLVFWVDRGDPVIVYEVDHGWARVSRCGDYGWCKAEYLGEEPPVDGLPEEFLEVELE